MDNKFEEQLDGLVEKYAELLLGEASEELKDKVKAWALYTHISKSMPPLAKHWNEQYPDAKEEMKTIVADIQQMNKAHREKNNK